MVLSAVVAAVVFAISMEELAAGAIVFIV